jgi:hypothetical protein
MKKCAYVKHELRLQDVMAAIQVMGTYDWDSSPVEKWTERMGEPISVRRNGTWTEVFKDHPVFFALEECKDPGDQQIKELASLKWRRANDKTYDPKTNRELTSGTGGSSEQFDVESETSDSGPGRHPSKNCRRVAKSRNYVSRT